VVEGVEDAGVVRVSWRVRCGGGEPVGAAGDGLAGDREMLQVFHAVITGSINDHCSSDKSLRYGLRSLTRSQHRINKRGPADSAQQPHHQAAADPLKES
jgi:hypothetical protein